MKDLAEQIEFLDNELLPAYGISSIEDFITEVTASSVKSRLEEINQCLPNLRSVYQVKVFNLHKTGYMVVKPEQAISILKQCLKMSSIPHNVTVRNAVRLIDDNYPLKFYKVQKRWMMADIRTFSDYVIPHHSVHPIGSVEKDPLEEGSQVARDSQDPREDSREDFGKESGSSSTDILKFLEPNGNNVKRSTTTMFLLNKNPCSKNILVPTLSLRKKLVNIRFNVVTSKYVDLDKVRRDLEKVAKYNIVIGGVEVHADNLLFDRNLLPTEYIVPIDTELLYHDIVITAKFSGVAKELWDVLDCFEVHVSSVKMLKSSFEKIHGKPILLPWGERTLRLESNMAFLQGKTKGLPLVIEDAVASTTMKVVSGVTIGCAQDSYKALCALLGNTFDMTSFQEKVIIAFVDNVVVTESSYQHFHCVSRVGDTCGAIEIIECSCPLSSVVIYYMVDDIKVPAASINDLLQMGLLNHMTSVVYVVFEFSKDTDLRTLSIEFLLTYYLYKSAERKQLSQCTTDMIDIRQFFPPKV
jgi:hypothetical protein